MAPIRTERAPSGVTRMAGAKAYAAKLQTSPRTTAGIARRKKSARKTRRLGSGIILPIAAEGLLRVPMPAHHKGLFK